MAARSSGRNLRQDGYGFERPQESTCSHQKLRHEHDEPVHIIGKIRPIWKQKGEVAAVLVSNVRANSVRFEYLRVMTRYRKDKCYLTKHEFQPMKQFT